MEGCLNIMALYIAFGTVKLALPRYVINSNLRHLEPYSTIKIERTKKKELCTKIKIKTVMKKR